jgi:hypothetical protein
MRVIQPIDPATLWKAIQQRHCRTLSGAECRVLALVLQGYSNDECARLLGVAAPTVRRHVADMCQKVFDVTEIPPEREKLRIWGPEHLDCCHPLVKEMIENDRKLA